MAVAKEELDRLLDARETPMPAEARSRIRGNAGYGARAVMHFLAEAGIMAGGSRDLLGANLINV